jgi:nucleoside-diphosphate-sugar epimerase
MKRKAIVLGGAGFIGHHLVNRLKEEGYFVRAVDINGPQFGELKADEFFRCDLRGPNMCAGSLNGEFDEIYQLAADMGGAGYIFTGENDANVMHNSALINLNVAYHACHLAHPKKIFYSSSACIYPEHIQRTLDVSLRETDAVPAAPDSCYGWEKLFSEKMYDAFRRNYGHDIRIARFHNIFGPEGTYRGGREKAPAAICRKVAEAKDTIEIWGDGEQTRSFLYIDECIEAVRRLMESDCTDVVNIGSNEMVSINQLVAMVCEISGKDHIFIKHIDGPQGVRGRNSNNEFIKEKLGWAPSKSLYEGLEKTYAWIFEQVLQERAIAW